MYTNQNAAFQKTTTHRMAKRGVPPRIILLYIVTLLLPFRFYKFEWNSLFSLTNLALFGFYVYVLLIILSNSTNHKIGMHVGKARVGHSTVILFLLIIIHLLFFLSLSINSGVNLSPNILLRLFGGLLVFFVPVFALRELKDFSGFLFLLVLLTIGAELTTLLSALGVMPDLAQRMGEMEGLGSSYFSYRSTGLINGFGDHATLFSFVLPLLLLSFIKKPHTWYIKSIGKLAALILILILFISSIALQSRNVWIATLFSLTIFGCLLIITRTKPGQRLVVISFYIGLMSFAMIGLSYAYTRILDLISILINIRPESVSRRLEVFQRGWSVFIGSPWIGIGLFAYESLYNEVIHNVVLNLLVSGGIVALLLMTFVVGGILVNLIRSYRKSGEGKLLAVVLLSGFAGMMVAGMFYGQLSSWFFWLFLGTITAFLEINKKPIR